MGAWEHGKNGSRADVDANGSEENHEKPSEDDLGGLGYCRGRGQGAGGSEKFARQGSERERRFFKSNAAATHAIKAAPTAARISGRGRGGVSSLLPFASR